MPISPLARVAVIGALGAVLSAAVPPEIARADVPTIDQAIARAAPPADFDGDGYPDRVITADATGVAWESSRVSPTKKDSELYKRLEWDWTLKLCEASPDCEVEENLGAGPTWKQRAVAWGPIKAVPSGRMLVYASNPVDAGSADTSSGGKSGGVTADSMGGGKTPGVAATGFGSSPALAAPAPLPDPVDDPGGFLSGAKTIWKTAWPLAIVMILVSVMLTLQKRVAKLRQEGTRLAAGVAGLITVGTTLTAYLAGEAALAHVFSVAAIALAAVLSPHAPPTVK